MKPLMHPLAGLALLLPLAANAASLGSYPATETCQADREASYAEGFSAGEANGWNLGHQAGHDFGVRSCVADPLQFGVTLASVIPPASYGETEPNDNVIAADPLAQGNNFWGQLYGAADQDWFYTETRNANQNILVTFSVPSWISDANLLEGRPAIWNVSVRDAAGNVFANFNTNVMGAINSYDYDRETFYSMTYSITAGLAGTYYVVVKPVDTVLTASAEAYPYSVAVVVQDSPLVNDQPVVGFFDSEIEPNNVPSRANPLANGVSMYGLISLTFNAALPGVDDDSNYVWGQGEDDWFVYNSNGNEIVTLNFCAKERCGPGNWFVEVYDQAMANRFEAGEPRENLTPLLSINTDTTNDPNATFRIGFQDPGYYFMKVNHKRLFTAPCLMYQFASTESETGFTGWCECESGNSCDIPTDGCSDSELGLFCKNETIECSAGVDPGCLLADGQGGRPQFPADCPVLGEDGSITTPCATYQTLAHCSCSQYGGVVQVPENEYTSPYNFTWYGTQLPPSTVDTDAYEDYLDRSNPYTP